MPTKDVTNARETGRQLPWPGATGQPSEARIAAASSSRASGATTWSPLPPSWARLCSFSTHQPNRWRTGPLARIAACTRLAGMVTSVSVSRPRRRRKPVSVRSRRKPYSRKHGADQAGADSEQDQQDRAADDCDNPVRQDQRAQRLASVQQVEPEAALERVEAERVAHRLRNAEQAGDDRQREVEQAGSQHAAAVHRVQGRALRYSLGQRPARSPVRGGPGYARAAPRPVRARWCGGRLPLPCRRPTRRSQA